MKRRGVAPALSTVILVGATIAIAIAAYQYVASSLAISQARANFEDAKKAFEEMARWLNTFAFTKGASQTVPISLAHGILERKWHIIDIGGLGEKPFSYELRFYAEVQGYEEVIYGDKEDLLLDPSEVGPLTIVYVSRDADGRWFVALNTSRVKIVDQGIVGGYHIYSIWVITIDEIEFSGSGTTFNIKLLISNIERQSYYNLTQISLGNEVYNAFEEPNIVTYVRSHVKIFVSPP